MDTLFTLGRHSSINRQTFVGMPRLFVYLLSTIHCLYIANITFALRCMVDNCCTVLGRRCLVYVCCTLSTIHSLYIVYCTLAIHCMVDIYYTLSMIHSLYCVYCTYGWQRTVYCVYYMFDVQCIPLNNIYIDFTSDLCMPVFCTLLYSH